MAVDITSNNVKHSSETRSGVKVTKIAKCHIDEEKKMIDLIKNQNNVNLSRTLIYMRNRNSSYNDKVSEIQQKSISFKFLRV